MPWRAISLELDAARAEALSEALLEAGAQSVWFEPGGALCALLPESAEPREALARAAAAAGQPVPAFTDARVADQDWVRVTQAQFPPQCIAGRLWIVPSWHAAPDDGVVIRLDPGLAFGTGSHPSTRLVLAWLAQAPLAGARVLDYGCGSGILALAAAKLGAACVDAVDVDGDALRATRENARANDVAVNAYAPEALPAGTYDILVANILAQPLLLLEPLLAARVRRGGRVALSGLLAEQAGELERAYGEHFEALAHARQEDGWALVEGARR